MDALVAPWPRPVILPHAAGQPPVRGILQKALKPKRVLVPASGVCFKSRGVDCIAVVCVSEGEVVIPPRPHHNLAAVGILLFVEVRAEAVAVDVFGHLVGEVKVREGMRVDVGRVPKHGIHEIVSGQGVLEGCEVVLDVRQLVGMQVVRFGLVQLDVHLPAAERGVRRWPPAFKIALDSVDLQDVPAGDFIAVDVGGQQRGDVHAVLVALDVLHEQVHAPVVAVDEEFAEATAGRVAVDLVAHLVHDRVADEAFVRVRAVEDPVVFCRHAQQRHVVVHPEGILGLQGVRLLGEELGGRSSNLDGDLAVVLVGFVVDVVEPTGVVGHRHGGHDARLVHDRGGRGDLNEGQVGLVEVHARAVVDRG